MFSQKYAFSLSINFLNFSLKKVILLQNCERFCVYIFRRNVNTRFTYFNFDIQRIKYISKPCFVNEAITSCLTLSKFNTKYKNKLDHIV